MKYISLLMLLMLMSCGENSSKKIERIAKEGKQQKEERTISAKSELIKYYNPIIGWDSAKVFTYWYQENLCGDQKTVAFEGTLKDIIKIDSVNYVVKLYREKDWSSGAGDRVFLVECRISIKQKVAIENDIKHTKGLFILKIEKVEAHFPEISTEQETHFTQITEDESLESEEFYINYNFDEKLIVFKGYLIDFKLYEN